MGKVIRPTYPKEVSIGLLLLIFVVAVFLSHQIFDVHPHYLNDGKNVHIGTVLIGLAVVLMFLVLWEEFLFPIKIKLDGKEVVFRNHRSKLKKQMLIYCIIPVIFAFIYVEYYVNLLRYIIWTTIVVLTPIVGKLVSGIKNYNDFLKLTDDIIEYKNNEKEGVIQLKDVQKIILVKDDGNVLHKLQLMFINGENLVIDLDEMELEAYLVSIDKFISAHYSKFLK